MAVVGTCVFELLALQGSVVKTRIILPPKTSRLNRKAPGTGGGGPDLSGLRDLNASQDGDQGYERWQGLL